MAKFTFSSRRGFSQPHVVLGPDKPIPETRAEILERMVDAVTDPGNASQAYRQNFSNGEFISRSLIVGATFGAAANRGLDLDGAGHVVHRDPGTGLFWRTGGSFD